jgi:hypothetical protein
MMTNDLSFAPDGEKSTKDLKSIATLKRNSELFNYKPTKEQELYYKKIETIFKKR